MDAVVFAAVLGAALLHASWNVLVKAAGGNSGGAMLIAFGSGVAALPAVAMLPLPASASWPALAASSLIHVAYFRLVAAAYREGALSIAYPLMRGVPPLLVGVTMAAFSEPMSLLGWLAILALAVGVILVAGEGFHSRSVSRRGAVAVAANVVAIAGFTLVDGHGVRASGNAASYAAWLFVLSALALLPWLQANALRSLRAAPLRFVFGTLCSVGSYAIALWAMTRAPIALVAALRETSVLFATALAALFLKERFGALRWGAVALTVAAAAAMRIA